FGPPPLLKETIRQRLHSVVEASDFSREDSTASTRLSWPRRLLRSPARFASAAMVAVVAGGVIAALLLWPTQMTLAQVQSAVNGVEWAHLKYENGREYWISPV